ncbi:oligopeptide/dipeptide ABC transporter ATP-binding protein [Kribbella aluminosa]|uniref:Oligopeptide/dipeptide ABC transporter ATP-binding protein n=1 Tax=Kribbella aluminosa TaxID=416017 RepID=A0ABS4UJJ5_9ACTN|nr:oligopeptide/dipeptide ABC transporter ATP-binding protein [Kribbella aluminosa]MBP2351832.1 oligopeptide/dipeptide ABC transporter ATP-binding protein [Kribbella aluminosa]
MTTTPRESALDQTVDQDILLRVQGLTKSYGGQRSGVRMRRANQVHALRDVSFDVRRGETLGLVGESGSGKSTAASCVLRLVEPDGGSVEFDSIDVLGLSSRQLRRLRSRMQMVFQDPYGSLDPRFSVRELVEEPLLIHGEHDADVRRTRALEMLERVGLSADLAERNAHAFSGGQRQRIAIARALVLNPELVVLDEPVTALDVSVQAQVLNLLTDLQAELGLTYLFIVHDLAVAQYVCHRIAVMYLGEIVELADSDELFANPLHPYTVSLLLAAPVPDPDVMVQTRSALRETKVQQGVAASHGCSLRSRCPVGADRPECLTHPPLREVTPGHFVACHYPGELQQRLPVQLGAPSSELSPSAERTARDYN